MSLRFLWLAAAAAGMLMPHVAMAQTPTANPTA